MNTVIQMAESSCSSCVLGSPPDRSAGYWLLLPWSHPTLECSLSEKFGAAYKEIRLKWHDKIDYQCGSGLVSPYQPGRQLTMAPGLVAKLCCPIRHARRAIQLKNTVKLAQMKSWDVALWPQPTKVAINAFCVPHPLRQREV